MTPHEWKDWIIGGQDKLLDIRENNLHSAVAHGMVQGGKRLVGMHKEIERLYSCNWFLISYRFCSISLCIPTRRFPPWTMP